MHLSVETFLRKPHNYAANCNVPICCKGFIVPFFLPSDRLELPLDVATAVTVVCTLLYYRSICSFLFLWSEVTFSYFTACFMPFLGLVRLALLLKSNNLVSTKISCKLIGNFCCSWKIITLITRRQTHRFFIGHIFPFYLELVHLSQKSFLETCFWDRWRRNFYRPDARS